MSRNRTSAARRASWATVAIALTTAALWVPTTTAADAAGRKTPESHAPKVSRKAEAAADRSAKMRAAHKAAPVFRAAAKVYTVNTTGDYPLANPSGTACIDNNTGKCSLRAAVEAANNLNKPARILLKANTYTLSSGSELDIYNSGGTQIVGKGATKTAIKGDGSGVLYAYVDAAGHGALLFLTDLKVTGGTSSYGAGLYLDYSSAGASAVLDGVIISGNTATSYGGGIYASDYNSLWTVDSKINGNVAPDAAGMYAYNMDGEFNNTTFNGNHSPDGDGGYGGGVYMYEGNYLFNGGSISSNRMGDASNSGYGGGAYMYYASAQLRGTKVEHNTASDGGLGGGLYVYFSSLDMTKGSLSHNITGGDFGQGGGIYTEYGAQVGLHGVTIAGNKTLGDMSDGYGGGAVFLYGYEYGTQLVIDKGSKITGNNASAIFGYVYYGGVDISISDSTLSGNHSFDNNGLNDYGCGGAVCIDGYEYGGSNLEMTNNTLKNNSSIGNYGAGAVTVATDEYAAASVKLTRNTFQKNSTGADGYGGAVGFYNDNSYSPISARMESNKFIGNKAGTTSGPGWGGALSIYYYAAVTDKGSTFSGNRVVGDSAYGGGVMDYSYQSSSWTGTKFLNNKAGGSSDANGYGGGYYSSNYAGSNFTNVTISGNTAASYGGGIYADSSSYQVSLDKSTLSGNTAGGANEGYGGGIYVSGGVLTVKNSTVAKNTAKGSTGQGGGINFQGSAHIGVRYSTISGNVAGTASGLYAYGGGGAILASIISGNHKASGAENDCAVGSGYSKPVSVGKNVLGQSSCVVHTQASDKVTKKPGLKPLANNGGPTKTMALTKKSKAKNRGSGSFCPATDQRGVKRKKAHCDAGAYQRKL